MLKTYLSLIIILITGCAANPINTTQHTEPKEVVVLLHGLMRTDQSLTKMQKQLDKAGYFTVNIHYPSTKHSIEFLADSVLAPALKPLAKNPNIKINFVTHSLGGIVTRYYLKNNPLSNLGRVVMISPPNNGSQVVDVIGGLFFYKWFAGPAGEELGTTINSTPVALGPVDFELGVITGDKTLNPILSIMIPGKDDGKVSVESAQVKGMKDFIVLPHTHIFIMQRKETIRETLNFLKSGSFSPKHKKALTSRAQN